MRSPRLKAKKAKNLKISQWERCRMTQKITKKKRYKLFLLRSLAACQNREIDFLLQFSIIVFLSWNKGVSLRLSELLEFGAHAAFYKLHGWALSRERSQLCSFIIWFPYYRWSVSLLVSRHRVNQHLEPRLIKTPILKVWRLTVWLFPSSKSNGGLAAIPWKQST